MIRTLVLVLLALVLVGCGAGGNRSDLKSENDLVGSWKLIGASDSLELLPDGRFFTTYASRITQGTWKIEEGQYCVTYGDGSGGCSDYALDGDYLTIITDLDQALAEMAEGLDIEVPELEDTTLEVVYKRASASDE